MTISAKIIADSIAAKSRRLTTFQLTYPRFIHAEFMTHRQFSRNASSSRAIPVEKQIQMILEDTAQPEHWGANQRGMQAEHENSNRVMVPKAICTTEGRETMPTSMSPQQAWYEARDRAVEVARAYHEAGYHKQLVNRILEPFSHITVVCTSTQYDNFFSLRCHKDAQPEIKILADQMRDLYEASTPNQLTEGMWHLPYITDEELAYVGSPENIAHDPIPTTLDDLIKASVARCARVSYLTHDGKSPSMEADLNLYERLVGMVPLHASPAEHQATPDSLVWNEVELASWNKPHLHGNLTGGWIQYRKLLVGECFDTWEDPFNVFD